MHPSKRELIDALREGISANRAASQALEAEAALMEQGIQVLMSGELVSETMRMLPLGEYRKATQIAFDHVSAARQRRRRLTVAMSQEEGMSSWEIANSWAVSRQLVDRYTQENKKEDERHQVPSEHPE